MTDNGDCGLTVTQTCMPLVTEQKHNEIFLEIDTQLSFNSQFTQFETLRILYR